MLYRISVAERGLTGIANIFRSRLSRLDDLLRAGTVPLTPSRRATFKVKLRKLGWQTWQPGHSICGTYNTFDIWKLSKSYIIRNDTELNVFSG